MIETKSFDLGRPVNGAREVVSFTAVNDFRWAGIIDLPPCEQLLFDTNIHNDFYILQGGLTGRAGPNYTRGAFFSPGADKTFMAGPEGARVFAYQGRGTPSCEHAAIMPGQLEWRTGGTLGMKVASLMGAGHELMLVAWAPGTRMRLHHHPRGEEIFVLQGELHDQLGRYPAGTWQRLHPGMGHAPYAEMDTLILLRNGHLYGPSGTLDSS